jgi:hypothetical protein
MKAAGPLGNPAERTPTTMPSYGNFGNKAGRRNSRAKSRRLSRHWNMAKHVRSGHRKIRRSQSRLLAHAIDRATLATLAVAGSAAADIPLVALRQFYIAP